MADRARAVLSVSLYPVLMAASLAACLLALGRGFDSTRIVVAINVVGAGLIFVAERVLPYRREWQASKGDVPTDLLHMIASSCGRLSGDSNNFMPAHSNGK